MKSYKASYSVTPAKAGVQNSLKLLDRSRSLCPFEGAYLQFYGNDTKQPFPIVY